MSSSLEPTGVNVNLPRDIYELILLETAQTDTDQITTSPRSLPQNGEARQNRSLALLLTLDDTTCNFLRRLTWSRLGIFYDEEDPNNSEVPAQDLLKLQTKFENNKSFTKQIEIHLTMRDIFEDGPENHQQRLEAVEKLIEMINISSQILNTANADQIEIISIHLDHLDDRFLLLTDDTDFGLTQNSVNQELRQAIDNLITPILSFQNLTQFEWVSSLFSCVSEQYLGWIVNQLPNLESFALSSPEFAIAPTLERNIDLGTSLASREKLKTLVLRDLHTIKESWLGLQWEGKVKEITIKVSRAREDCLLEKDLLSFCHLFHQSLTGLYLLRDDHGSDTSSDDQDFENFGDDQNSVASNSDEDQDTFNAEQDPATSSNEQDPDVSNNEQNQDPSINDQNSEASNEEDEIDPTFDFGWPGEEPLILDFNLLTFIAFDGNSGNLPVFGTFTNVEILFWIDFNKEINALQKFANQIIQNENQWTHLRMIVLQPVSGDSTYQPDIPEQFRQFCVQRSIQLRISNPKQLADLEAYYYDRVKISDLEALLATGSRIQLS